MMAANGSSPLVLVTGGAGYVGSVLVPRLLADGYRVRVLDLYVFGDDGLAEVAGHPRLEQVRADIRDLEAVKRTLVGVDTVIHLACISNDPSCDLDPRLTRAVNLDAFDPLVEASRAAGASRFIFAASSSVYGVSDAPEVTEEHPLEPITDYNRYKGMCEEILFEHTSPEFTTVSIRPATVCGWSPRLRLDLTVNILTAHAVERRKITVFGGTQQRPNIHIEDMVDLYRLLLEAPAEKISGEAFNAGYQNHTVAEIATIVRAVIEREMPELAPIEIETTSSDDPRSYHISSEKLRRELGFVPKRSIEEAVHDLVVAFRAGRVPAAMDDSRYYNVRTMKELGLE